MKKYCISFALNLALTFTITQNFSFLTYVCVKKYKIYIQNVSIKQVKYYFEIHYLIINIWAFSIFNVSSNFLKIMWWTILKFKGYKMQIISHIFRQKVLSQRQKGDQKKTKGKKNSGITLYRKNTWIML